MRLGVPEGIEDIGIGGFVEEQWVERWSFWFHPLTKPEVRSDEIVVSLYG
jgi:hypothetical protein